MINIDNQDQASQDQAQSINAADAFGGLQDEMPPEVERTAPSPENPTEPSPAPPTDPDLNTEIYGNGVRRGDLDDHGTAFHPYLFEPEKTNGGHWKKHRGTKAAKYKAMYVQELESTQPGAAHDDVVYPSQERQQEQQRIEEETQEAERVANHKLEIDVLATMTVEHSFTLAQLCLGPAWEAQDGEKDILKEPVASLLMKYNSNGISPELTLVLVVAGLAAKRMGKPEATSNLRRIKGWFGRVVKRFKKSKAHASDNHEDIKEAQATVVA